MRYISYTKRVYFDGGGKEYTLFHIEFYETEDGKTPVEDFMDSLDNKISTKLVGLLEVLEEKGTDLRAPYTKHLEDGIFELRCIFGNDIIRVLFFYYYGGLIVLTNGYIKKTQKTPRKEIKLAKNRRNDWIRRHGIDELRGD